MPNPRPENLAQVEESFPRRNAVMDVLFGVEEEGSEKRRVLFLARRSPSRSAKSREEDSYSKS